VTLGRWSCADITVVTAAIAIIISAAAVGEVAFILGVLIILNGIF
jgi:hypothetical protein